MATLNIHVERFFEGEALDEGGAIADIRPLGKDRPGSDIQLNDLLVPAGEAPNVAPLAVHSLPVGDYVVRVRLPSGETLSEMVRLDNDDASVPVVFKPEQSPREWLSWQTYLGDVAERQAPSPQQQAQGSGDAGNIPPPAAKGLDTSLDNLQAIRGIGPTIETALKQVGIEQIGQIASLTRGDIDRLARKVAPYAAWIDNFDWVSQAADILKQRPAEDVPTDAKPESFSEMEEADPELPPPAMIAFTALEGTGQPLAFYPILDTAIRANRETPLTLAENLENLRVHGTQTGSGEAFDPAPFGHMDSMGAVTVWGLRTGLPQTPDQFDPQQPCLRTYLVADDGFVQWLTTLPLPWINLRHGTPAGLDILFDRTHVDRCAMDITPRDGHMASFLGYLKSGDSRANQAILRSAREYLFDKLANPYSAAAGGYVLINSKRWGGARSRPEIGGLEDERWGAWLDNLSNWFPWLPDGRILRAWFVLLSGDGEPDEARIDEARFHLLAAARAGLPVCTGVFRLMMDGLKVLRAHAEDKDMEDPAVDEALKQLDMVAMRIDTRQVFTTVRITPRRRAEQP